MTNCFNLKYRFREYLGYLLILGSVIGLDQYVKFLCRRDLRPVLTIDLWAGVFRLRYCENIGAAFSILEGKTWFFVIITLLFCGVIFFLLFSDRIRSNVGKIALLWVVAGGVGNLIDRLVFGYVTDMFDFYLINFAVFNVADIFVCCGCILFILVYIYTKGRVLAE